MLKPLDSESNSISTMKTILELQLKISRNLRYQFVIKRKTGDPDKEWQIPPEETKKRVDLRSKRIFTIDPITAKDLDDALSVDKISEGVYEIGVHIADVSFFVEENSQLDTEARLRCTSVYFVHEVIPMLPRLLCERLCSLNPAVDRLSYSVFFRMREDGTLVEDFKPVYQRTVELIC